MSRDEREQLHVRLTRQSMDIIDYALVATSSRSNQQVIDEALKVYNMFLRDTYDVAREELKMNFDVEHRRIDRIEELAKSDRVTKGVVEVPVPVINPPLPDANPFAKHSRDELLAKCRDTQPSMVADWAKNWKQELTDVGWTINEFVACKMANINKESVKVKEEAPAAVQTTGQTPSQYRIEMLVRRLYNVALGEKGLAHFTKDFENVRALNLDGRQLDQFKSTVISKFRNKLKPDIIAKKVKTENEEVVLALFEDAWFREFETSEEDKQMLVN